MGVQTYMLAAAFVLVSACQPSGPPAPETADESDTKIRGRHQMASDMEVTAFGECDTSGMFNGLRRIQVDPDGGAKAEWLEKYVGGAAVQVNTSTDFGTISDQQRCFERIIEIQDIAATGLTTISLNFAVLGSTFASGSGVGVSNDTPASFQVGTFALLRGCLGAGVLRYGGWHEDVWLWLSHRC